MNIITVSVNMLVRAPYRRKGRGQEADLADLAFSIQEFGFIYPLLAYKKGKRYCLIDGHRRLDAAKLIDLTEVPVLVMDITAATAETVYAELHLYCPPKR